MEPQRRTTLTLFIEEHSMTSFLITLFYGKGRTLKKVALGLTDFDTALEGAAGYPMNTGTRRYLYDRLPHGLAKDGVLVAVEPLLDVVVL